jgi:hypothetical protein
VKTAGSAWQLVTYKSGTKSLEFDFRKVNGAYRGTAIVAGATVATRDPNGSTVWPEWIKVEFDSDADGAGTSSLVISLTGFRTQADIGTANFEQAIIKLTKGSDGVVTLGSIIKVPNSRHFVWNGYTKDTTTNTDTLNTAVTGETRYYCAAGRSSADGTKATVHLGIPTAVAAATVFADYGLGALIGQLFADRLNNNYDFDGTADTAYDQGGELIAALNSINPGDKDLATGSPAVNTAAKVREALVSAQSLVTTSNAWLDWLVGVELLGLRRHGPGRLSDARAGRCRSPAAHPGRTRHPGHRLQRPLSLTRGHPRHRRLLPGRLLAAGWHLRYPLSRGRQPGGSGRLGAGLGHPGRRRAGRTGLAGAGAA